MNKSKKIWLAVLFILMQIYNCIAAEIPKDIRNLLLNVANSPEEEIKRGEDLEQFLAEHKDQIGLMLANMSPDDPLAVNLARCISSRSKPRDFLIIVSKFFQVYPRDETWTGKGDTIVSTLLYPDKEDLQGLIAMNYMLPELHNALSRAEPKISEKHNSQIFVRDILSGAQKQKTIKSFENQGKSLPAVFSTIYPDDERLTSPRPNSEKFPVKTVPGAPYHPADSESLQFDFRPSSVWWVLGLIVCILMCVMFWKKMR